MRTHFIKLFILIITTTCMISPSCDMTAPIPKSAPYKQLSDGDIIEWRHDIDITPESIMRHAYCDTWGMPWIKNKHEHIASFLRHKVLTLNGQPLSDEQFYAYRKTKPYHTFTDKKILNDKDILYYGACASFVCGACTGTCLTLLSSDPAIGIGLGCASFTHVLSCVSPMIELLAIHKVKKCKQE